MLVGDLYRLGDLQFSKIKRAANQVLSLSEFAQLSFGTWIFSRGSLSWDAQNLQWSSQPQPAGGCGVFIGGDPNGEMTEVT